MQLHYIHLECYIGFERDPLSVPDRFLTPHMWPMDTNGRDPKIVCRNFAIEIQKNESTFFFLTKIKSSKSIRTLSKYVKSITENGTNFSFSLMYCKYWSNNKPLKINKHINLLNKISKLEEFFNYPDTPYLPNVRVLEISGRIHARSFRCCGSRSQSSQDLIWLTMAHFKKNQLLNEEFALTF